MANDRQFKTKTLFVATRGVAEYRKSIDEYIKPNDIVLEIGCEWGTTSELILPKCKQLIATDVSQECIDRGKQMRPNIDFRVLDVYDIRTALSWKINFNKMYIDVSGLSGYRSLLDVISLMDMYAKVFDMEAIVIKSGSLKNFIKNCRYYNPLA